MRGLLVTVWLAMVVGAKDMKNVVRFAMVDKPQSVRLLHFSFNNCMSPDLEKAVVNSLSLSPDPLEFPGPLKVAFNVTIKETLQSPLKAVVFLTRRVGSVWIKIPCFEQVGSCNYDKLCQILAMIKTCPEPFTSAGIPCKCPFSKGQYNLPEASFDVETDPFPAGEYRAQANLTMNDEVIGCYDITASFN